MPVVLHFTHMILPIIAYGDPVLKKVAVDVDQNDSRLTQLIADMYETMYAAKGVGLAAPQVGASVRLFIVDARPFAEDEEHKGEGLEHFKKVFINAKILDEKGEPWLFNEGCLSIPEVREDVERQAKLKIEYYDEKFARHEEEYSGIPARIIQHEYDHIEGKLFTDRLSPLKKRMLKNRLEAISRGEVRVEYKMKFPVRRKK